MSARVGKVCSGADIVPEVLISFTGKLSRLLYKISL